MNNLKYKSTIKWAQDYINYGVKNGYLDEDVFINMANEDKIEFVRQHQLNESVLIDNALGK